MENSERKVFSEGLEKSAKKRITGRLMPFLIVLFIIAYIDRVNVGYAALQMTDDLGFSAEILGLGAGIFFLGYFIFEIPGSLIVEKWSARKWLARIIISWGIIAVLMGFIQNATQFYIARFLLGVAEAGFFPGIIVYLSHWFRYQDRAKAVAMFMTALPIANIFGSPVSGLILPKMSVARRQLRPGIAYPDHGSPAKIVVRIALITQPRTMNETHLIAAAEPLFAP